jgi:hypothetical protein
MISNFFEESIKLAFDIFLLIWALKLENLAPGLLKQRTWYYLFWPLWLLLLLTFLITSALLIRLVATALYRAFFVRSLESLSSLRWQALLSLIHLVPNYLAFFYLSLSLVGEMAKSTAQQLWLIDTFTLSLKFILPLLTLSITTPIAYFKTAEMVEVLCGYLLPSKEGVRETLAMQVEEVYGYMNDYKVLYLEKAIPGSQLVRDSSSDEENLETSKSDRVRGY